ncbi:hypothetical protein Q3G72_022644 [Acer saccharum]|nr:hypothetical protein Q3G72_022644 [Acer saccharum]
MTFFISCLLPAFSTFTPSSFAMSRFEKSSKLGEQGMVVDSYVEEHRVNQMRFTLRDPYALDCETNMVDSATLDGYRKHPVGVIPHHFMKYFTWMNDSQDLWEVKMVTRPLSESRASVLYAKSTLLERRIISRLPPM